MRIISELKYLESECKRAKCYCILTIILTVLAIAWTIAYYATHREPKNTQTQPAGEVR